MLSVKIFGAGGYGGVGLIETLLRHPQARIVALVDVADVGRKVSEVWPHLQGFCDLLLVSPQAEEAKAPADIVFCATPDTVGMKVLKGQLAAGAKAVDFSGDFRFRDAQDYAEYAGRLGLPAEHGAPELLPESVYGLTELYRGAIAGARLVGNPGCFAVSLLLGLAPAVKERLVEPEPLFADSKSGISGAGKKPRAAFHYPESYETTYAYRLGGHQHVVEVERVLAELGGSPLRLTFTPHVVPMTRGIASALYGKLAPGITQRRVLEAFRAFYDGEPFVRVFDRDGPCGTGHVRGSNACNLVVACQERNGCFRVLTHIDNLVKGQAGSAVQNMNVMFGLPETMGLDLPGSHP